MSRFDTKIGEFVEIHKGMLCNGGGGGKDVTQTSEPWSGQRQHLLNIFEGAEGLYQGAPLRFYPGETFARMSPRTTEALGMVRRRARAGSPLQAAGTEAMRATAAGEMLNANPYLDATYQRAARPMADMFREATSPGIQSRMMLAGRSGSGAENAAFRQAEDQLARGLGELATDIYGRNYASERGRQMQAAAMAPQMAAADYADANQLMRVGAAEEEMKEAKIADAMARFNFGQMEPWDRLGRYSAFVQGGNWGGETSQPIYRNRAAGTMGGVLGGAALGSMFGGYGAPIGAGIGGLLGMF